MADPFSGSGATLPLAARNLRARPGELDFGGGGMNLVHDLGAWWFFADTHFSPAAVFGAVCVGTWLHFGYGRIRK